MLVIEEILDLIYAFFLDNDYHYDSDTKEEIEALYLKLKRALTINDYDADFSNDTFNFSLKVMYIPQTFFISWPQEIIDFIANGVFCPMLTIKNIEEKEKIEKQKEEDAKDIIDFLREEL